MGIQVLVAQDDLEMATLLCDVLRAEGHSAEAMRISEALARVRSHVADVIIIDWLARSSAARELCLALRQSVAHGLLVTTISSNHAHLRTIFEAGADDVVHQPYELEELLLRISALARRTYVATHGEGELRVGAIGIGHGQARVEGKAVPATQRELAMLTHLARRADRTVTTSELGTLVWGKCPPSSNAVVAHVNHLRSKLGPAAAQLRTVRGVGYLLSSKDTATHEDHR
jgi:DNA-binding response OmpR family regulator